MSKILFLDTETNGLPRDFKAPYTDTKNWPRIVQLAWAIYDQAGQKIKEQSFIIRPDNWTIGAETSNIHGITTERAKSEGVPIAGTIDALEVDLIGCDYVVCHNVAFDRNVLLCEYMRLGQFLNSKAWGDSVLYPGIRHYCSMEMATPILQIPGLHGNKWPKLDELYFFLFNNPVPGREKFHDAMVDVRATAMCFFKLKRIKQGFKPDQAEYGFQAAFPEMNFGGKWKSESDETLFENHLKVWNHFNEKR